MSFASPDGHLEDTGLGPVAETPGGDAGTMIAPDRLDRTVLLPDEEIATDFAERWRILVE